MTKGELKAVINSYSHRTHKDGDLNNFIDAAAIKIGRDGKLFESEAEITYNNHTERLLPLPDDFLLVQSLQYQASIGWWPLPSFTEDQILKLTANDAGEPKGYYMKAGELYVAPVSAERTFRLTYQQRIPVLANDGSSNDILTGWPSTYVYGSVLEAGLQYQDDDLISKFKPLFDEEVLKLEAFADQQRLGAYSAIRSL